MCLVSVSHEGCLRPEFEIGPDWPAPGCAVRACNGVRIQIPDGRTPIPKKVRFIRANLPRKKGLRFGV